jgi:hypothetical protein
MFTPPTHTGEDPDIALQHPRMGFPQPELALLTTLTANLNTVRRGVYHETIPTTSLATSPMQLTLISSSTTEEPTSGATAREMTELGVILGVTTTPGGGAATECD